MAEANFRWGSDPQGVHSTAKRAMGMTFMRTARCFCGGVAGKVPRRAHTAQALSTLTFMVMACRTAPYETCEPRSRPETATGMR
eukprot:11625647-Alexandrium_andersonii.AAC.1